MNFRDRPLAFPSRKLWSIGYITACSTWSRRARPSLNYKLGMRLKLCGREITFSEIVITVDFNSHGSVNPVHWCNLLKATHTETGHRSWWEADWTNTDGKRDLRELGREPTDTFLMCYIDLLTTNPLPAITQTSKSFTKASFQESSTALWAHILYINVDNLLLKCSPVISPPQISSGYLQNLQTSLCFPCIPLNLLPL